MTMMNEQRKRQHQQLIQQIRDLARAGQWQEAKRLADTLPETPDTMKMKERIEKQLFIATGEVPTVMEGSMALLDSELDEALLEGIPVVARKPKPAESDIPAYMPIRIVAYLVYGGGILAICFGIALFFSGFFVESYYRSMQHGSGFTVFLSGLFTMGSGSMMLMFVDIAQNTFRTNRLLVQLLYKDGMEGKGDV